MHTPRTRTAARLGLGAALALSCSAGLAQGTPDDPFADPLPVFRETDPIEPVDQTGRPATGTEPDSTDTPNVVDTGSEWLEQLTRERLERRRARLLAEGTFLTARPGRLLTAPSGHRVFLPDPSPRGGGAPIVLLPTRTLSSLDAATGGMDEPRVTLSGEILAWQGRNYLVTTAYRVGSSESASSTPAQPQTSPPQTGQPQPNQPADTAGSDASASDNPDVADLFDELSNTDAAAGLEPPRPTDTPEPEIGEPSPLLTDPAVENQQPGTQQPGTQNAEPTQDRARSTPLQEGTQIVRRRGRLARLSDGSWALYFDNDHGTAGATAAPDQPLTVFPCTTLARLAPRAQAAGDRLEVLASGRVYTYGSRRYLLPTRFTVPRELGVEPMQ